MGNTAHDGRRRTFQHPRAGRGRVMHTLAVLVAALLWSTAGPVRRQIDLVPEVAAAGRSGFGAVALGLALVVARVVQGRRSVDPVGGEVGARAPEFADRRRHRPGLIVLAGVALAVTWWCQYAAVDHLTVGAVYLIMYLSPVLVVVGSWFIGERPTFGLVGSLGVSILGVVIVASGTGGAGPSQGARPALGVALAVAAAFGLAGMNLFTKVALRRYSPTVVPMQQFVVASAILVPLAIARAERAPTAAEWRWLVVLGIVHSGLAVGLFAWGLTRVPVSQASVMAYAEPAGALVSAWLFLGERPAMAVLVGGVLTLGGGIAAIFVGDRSGEHGRARDAVDAIDGGQTVR